MSKIHYIVFIIALTNFALVQEKTNYQNFENLALIDEIKKMDLSLQNPIKVLIDTQMILRSLESTIFNINKQFSVNSPVQDKTNEMKFLSKRLRFLQEKENLCLESISTHKKYSEQLDEVQQRGKVVLKIRDQIDILLIEINLRLTVKSIKQEDVSEILKKYSVNGSKKIKAQNRKNLNDWQTKKKQANEKIKELENIYIVTKKKIKIIQDEIVLRSKKQEYIFKRQEIKDEFTEKENDILLALLSTSILELPKKERVIEEKSLRFSSQKEQLNELSKGLVVPHIDKIKLKSKIPSGIEAEKKWKFAKQLLEHKKNKSNKSKQKLTLLTRMLPAIEYLIVSSEEYREALVKVDVLIEVLFQKEIDLSLIEKQSYKLEINKQDLLNISYKKTKIELLEKKDLIEKLENDISLIIEKEKLIIVNLKTLYDKEIKWEKWVVEAEKLNDAQLKLELIKNLKKVANIKKQSEESQKTFIKIQNKILQKKIILSNIQSPFILRAQELLQNLYQLASTSVNVIAKEKKYEHSLGLERNLSNNNRVNYINKLVFLLQPNKIDKLNSLAKFGKQVDFFSSIITILKIRQKEEQELHKLLRQGLLEKNNIILLEKIISKNLRKSYGVALEFEIRFGKKQIKLLPKETAQAPSRSDLLSIDEKINLLDEEVKKIQRSLNEYSTAIKNTKIFSLFLEMRISKILEKLEYLRKMKKGEDNFESQKKTDTEQYRFEQKVYEKKIADSKWWENILAFFTSSEAEQHQKLLDAYYKDFVTLEQKIQNLNKRIIINKSLIEVANEEKDILENYKIEDFEIKMKRALAKIEAKIKPESQHKNIVNFSPDIILSKNLLANELIKYIPRATDEVFRLWVNILADKAWKKSISNELSKLGIETEIANYIEEIGRVESKKRQIQPEINSLIGYSRNTLQKLETIKKPENEERYLNGEINYTRNLRIKSLMHSALISILNIFLIPFIAFLLIRFMNNVGKKLIATAVGATYKRNKIREQRISTLAGILKTISISLIVIISGIYMLKQFRIDITPIIASAGILGLALAFGAQTLVRDYFSGFFILLENQYTTGDLVEIGGVVGYIYRVTLRLTVVQATDGTMHFFPNGTISHVSNKSKDSRAVIKIGVGYGESVDKILDILKEVAEDMKQDSNVGKMVLDEYEVSGLNSFDNSSITYRMWMKTTPGDQWEVKRATQRRIKIYFDKYGVEIPFPQRVVYNIQAPSKENMKEKEELIKNRFDESKKQLMPIETIQEIQTRRIARKEKMQIISEDEVEDVIEKIVVEDIAKKKARKRNKKKKKW